MTKRALFICLVAIVCLFGNYARADPQCECVLDEEYVFQMDSTYNPPTPRYISCCDNPNLKWLTSYIRHIGYSDTMVCYRHDYYGIRYCHTCGSIYNNEPEFYRSTSGCGMVLPY